MIVYQNRKTQCMNVIKTAEVQQAYREHQIRIYGWVFDIQSGALIDLKIDFQKILEGIMEIYRLD